MKAELQKLLEQTKVAQLRQLVEDVYGVDKQVDKAIEAALLASDPAALAKHLKKQIQSLNRGSRFIDYRESFQFSVGLDQLVEQISKLLPQAPKATFELIDLFMNTNENTQNRCDDSGGSVGDSYAGGRKLWLEAAVAWETGDQPCKLDWSEEIYKRHSNNGYAAWDNLIAGSLTLLGVEKLQALGARYEKNLRRALKDVRDDYSFAGITAKIGMEGVATALGDVAMYERATLIGSPEPNELQKLAIIKFCIECKNATKALQWLDGSWSNRCQYDVLSLKDAAFQLASDKKALLVLRQQAYEDKPDFHRLQLLLEVSSESQKKALLSKAEKRAAASDNLWLAVDTLLQLNAVGAAAKYVLSHPDQVHGANYIAQADWAKVFVTQDEPLAAVLLYRRLLLDILESARSKAYRHAARYYKALEQLDTELKHYKPLEPHNVFYESLQAVHGRKRSFWSKVQ